MSLKNQRHIEVWADWSEEGGPKFMGMLSATPSRGDEILSFDYDPGWLAGADMHSLDPSLGLFAGPQYATTDKKNFGLFLDSSPEQWGRMLIDRREAHFARLDHRSPQKLGESDYLLAVHDAHRMGGLRFRMSSDGPFLDDNQHLAVPAWTSLRDLEYASLQMDAEDAATQPEYEKWLQMLVAPGASLGGSRPKACVMDGRGQQWIAKFPSSRDSYDVGAWEGVVHELARHAGVSTAKGQSRKLGGHYRTFLSQRFDRGPESLRFHFASALTLLEREEGDDASSGASYLELAELIMRVGANAEQDLEQLWRRIVFSICVSNTDDHLRNHGFLLTPAGWVLSPAYDMNPNPHGFGLKLNISESDNTKDLALAADVAPYFRVKAQKAKDIIESVAGAVSSWTKIAKRSGISGSEIDEMSSAFSVVSER